MTLSLAPSLLTSASCFPRQLSALLSHLSCGAWVDTPWGRPTIDFGGDLVGPPVGFSSLLLPHKQAKIQ